MRRETIEKRLTMRQSFLDKAYEAYEKLLSGEVQSYTIGSRSLTKFDLSSLQDTIEKWEKEVDELEAQLNGLKKRKSVGVIPRDW
ncbi:MAG: DUF6148 family protein [Anaerovoracaceae bacterium]